MSETKLKPKCNTVPSECTYDVPNYGNDMCMFRDGKHCGHVLHIRDYRSAMAVELAAQITRMEKELAEAREALRGMQCCGNCALGDVDTDCDMFCRCDAPHLSGRKTWGSHVCNNWTARARLVAGEDG